MTALLLVQGLSLARWSCSLSLSLSLTVCVCERESVCERVCVRESVCERERECEWERLPDRWCGRQPRWGCMQLAYRGTSLTRKRTALGPYSRTMPRLLWRS
jgi:hypothetical protein